MVAARLMLRAPSLIIPNKRHLKDKLLAQESALALISVQNNLPLVTKDEALLKMRAQNILQPFLPYALNILSDYGITEDDLTKEGIAKQEPALVPIATLLLALEELKTKDNSKASTLSWMDFLIPSAYAKELSYDNVKTFFGEASGFTAVAALFWGSSGAVTPGAILGGRTYRSCKEFRLGWRRLPLCMNLGGGWNGGKW